MKIDWWTHLRCLCVVFASFAFTACSEPTTPDQLLPTAEAAKISLSVAQDGRAVHTTIENGSALVLTAIDITCTQTTPSTPLPPRGPSGREWCDPLLLLFKTENFDPTFGCDPQPDTSGQRLTAELALRKPVLPSNKHVAYIEMPASYQGVSCFADDLRGREMRLLDLF